MYFALFGYDTMLIYTIYGYNIYYVYNNVTNAADNTAADATCSQFYFNNNIILQLLNTAAATAKYPLSFRAFLKIRNHSRKNYKNILIIYESYLP